jgi:hypothetical protein
VADGPDVPSAKDDKSPPTLRALALACLVVMCVGCGAFASKVDGTRLAEGSHKIADCETAAELAPDGGNLATWHACRAEAGIP